MAECHIAPEFGHGRVVVGQLFLDLHCLAELGLRLRRPARNIQQQAAEVVVDEPQTTSNLRAGRVVLGQLLIDHQRLTILGLRLRRPARSMQQDADPVDGVREFAAGLHRRSRRLGQHFLIGPGLAEHQQAVAGLPRGEQQVPKPGPAVGQGGPDSLGG